MKKIAARTNSLYKKMLLLLLIAMGIGTAFYFGASYLGTFIVEHYYNSTDYEGRMNRHYADLLQAYVSENQVKATDQQKFEDWINQHSIMSIWVIRGKKVLYDSVTGVTGDLSDSHGEMYDEEYDDGGNPIVDEAPDENLFTMDFADGKADVYLFGAYSYSAYTYMQILVLVLTFILFIAIMLKGIRRAIHYIRAMRDEVAILEGGDLSYEITVKGNDELADLACAINGMRKALQDQFREESDLYAASSRMVAEMSHDLRTPLTSIILYTDLLQKGKFESEEQMWDYIARISRKSHQMKSLTDHLFEYALIGGTENEVPLSTHPFQDVFYDALSDMTLYLEGRGFHVETHANWNRTKVIVYDDYIPRLLDNIVSNIEKYAPRESRVIISTDASKEGCSGLIFENVIRHGSFHADSSHVGLMNIRKMMDVMHGTCTIENGCDTFRVTLTFRNV